MGAFAERTGMWGCMINFMPTPLLRQAMQDTFPQGGFMELSVKQAIDWVAQQMNDLSGNDLASRLSLNCGQSEVFGIRLQDNYLTILESNGETMVPDELRRQLKGLYSDARFAQLKSSGDFPYLSQPEEVTLFIEVHLRSLGIYPGGRVPGAEQDIADAHLLQGAATTPSWEFDAAYAPPEPAPTRRPVWKNPFEDDDLL